MKKKTNSTTYFNIKLAEVVDQESVEKKIKDYQDKDGTSIYAFYQTNVYVPFDNKVKEKDFKKLEAALKNHDFTTLDYHPVLFENTSQRQQNYGAFTKIEPSIGKKSWIYMPVVMFIELIDYLNSPYNIIINTSDDGIMVPRILWVDLKLLYNLPIVDLTKQEVEFMHEDVDYSIIKMQDGISVPFRSNCISFKKQPTQPTYEKITSLLDDHDVCVYVPFDLKIKKENEEQFFQDLMAFSYSESIKRSIFDSTLGKVVLMYTSQKYIPENLLHEYTWVSMNLMDALRVLFENKDWNYVLLDYLSIGLRITRSFLTAIYYDTFALGNPVELDEKDFNAIRRALISMDVDKAYLYEAYNRIGIALIYDGKEDINKVRTMMDELMPSKIIFVGTYRDYQVENDPFYIRSK